ncbi:MAG: ribonuclease E/G [Sphingorhabdus sp.]
MKLAFCCALRVTRLVELWLDDAPGERCAALVEDGRIVEIHVEREGEFVVGEVGSARIARKNRVGAYLQTQDGREILVRRNVSLPEGSPVCFQISRAAIAEPGLIKLAEARVIDSEPRSFPAIDVLWAKRIEMPDATKRHRRDISEGYDAALAGRSVNEEAVISFQRTKAGLVFDIDGTGDPLAINMAAARDIARLLRLYQVGAMVMIDFIAVESKRDRQLVAEAFDQASAVDTRAFERTAINGFGMMQVVRARPRPSVLDILFGTRIAALSDETQALWLLREASKSTGFGARTITALPAVARLLNASSWQAKLQSCQQLIGAPLSIVADPMIPGYGHVHVSQA